MLARHTRRINTAHGHSTGFNLFELVLVVAIVAVMAAIATPRFGAAHARYRVDLAARRIAADLAYAQTIARQTSSIQLIEFMAANDRYVLLGVNDLESPGNDYTVVLSDEPYRADIVSVSFENKNGYIANRRIRFNMWGRPASGNPLEGHPFAPLVDGSIVIQGGTETRTITIAPLTGKVRIQ